MKPRSQLILAAVLATACAVLPPVPATGLGKVMIEGRDSLEWTVVRAELIVRGSVTHPQQIKAGWPIAAVKVTETLKGRVIGEVTMAHPRQEMFNGDWLFFLSGTGPAYGEVFVILQAIDLSSGEAIPMDFNVISGKDPILQVASNAVALLTSDPKPDSMWLRAPAESPACQQKKLFDFELVRVPVVPRLEALARQWLQSGDREFRLEAVRVLEHFRSRENIQLLKGLLIDPASYVEGSQKKHLPFPVNFITVEQGGTRYYPVRRSAYEVLGRWNVEVPAPVMEEPADEVSGWTVGMIVAVPGVVLLVGLIAALRFRRREPRKPAAALT